MSSQPTPAHTYRFSVPQIPTQADSPYTKLALLVSRPQVGAGYNTQQIAYTRKPYELSYFSHNEWVDTPGRMLESILVSALEASKGFQNVIPSYALIPADLRLDTEIVTLLQDYSVKPNQSRVVLHARLIELTKSQEIASQTFEAHQPMTEDNPYSGVIALNQALGQVIEELVSFCTQASANADALNSSTTDMD
ncbi:ABC-type transport auxiliary lipoprotein family protein [Candidatus Nitrosoglobus terrae]|uniref:ABC-type transport auxiliary lipoprotein family protein n=1 Tax=Candidatus Nitrosoglobus terrae TaxID=1630141 RepID=UPI0015529A7E|nr:ABC-type transport auxiliary lipoprotein family protein [Candidatus Nitrosoglobus terrae]